MNCPWESHFEIIDSSGSFIRFTAERIFRWKESIEILTEKRKINAESKEKKVFNSQEERNGWWSIIGYFINTVTVDMAPADVK